jgi:hypothetical protein
VVVDEAALGHESVEKDREDEQAAQLVSQAYQGQPAGPVQRGALPALGLVVPVEVAERQQREQGQRDHAQRHAQLVVDDRGDRLGGLGFFVVVDLVADVVDLVRAVYLLDFASEGVRIDDGLPLGVVLGHEADSAAAGRHDRARDRVLRQVAHLESLEARPVAQRRSHF